MLRNLNISYEDKFVSRGITVHVWWGDLSDITVFIHCFCLGRCGCVVGGDQICLPHSHWQILYSCRDFYSLWPVSDLIISDSECKNKLDNLKAFVLKCRSLEQLQVYCNEDCASFSPIDPSIKPQPASEVDPTVFEKRFLKSIRDLGEVSTHCCFIVLDYFSLTLTGRIRWVTINIHLKSTILPLKRQYC